MNTHAVTLGGGGVRSIETQSGDSKTTTRVRDEKQ